ncbi:alpha/beta hydrolase [Streptomyces sp. MUM 203J]|uniref:alpha/beta hydrolase family protein n=1 Tax=Streptomyces sp. MUM 203J TaxID=2791990 RepID=UPI001F03BDD3|nr:alpha/beta hydrolase [Streptomyces sp. MUM 203J]MCH0540278.1 alpha/beta hydrolase [Streptomyces sp. MUM 203J]
MKTSRRPRVRRRAVTAALALSLAVTAAVPAAAHAAQDPAGTSAHMAVTGLDLPGPTGAFAVGRDRLHLVDRTRQDPWVPDQPRELMVDLSYPARQSSRDPASYMDAEEARELLAAVGVHDPERTARLAATRTHSVPGAGPRRGRYPLVVLSPGFGMPRYTLTTLAEDLASRGHVVAAVDHAYEGAGVAFPGGRTLTCVACGLAKTEEDLRRATVNRAHDLSFVLDRLTGPRPAWRHGPSLIDRKRIGAAGHSIGGAAAASVMRHDDRVEAGINMDGAFGDPVPEGGLGGRPFLMLGTHEGNGGAHLPGGWDATWGAAWSNLDGWKRWLTVAGASHSTFSDAPLLYEQLGIPSRGPSEPAAARSVELTRTYTAAFFGLHLRHRPQPLLDGPTAEYPEVHFNEPGVQQARPADQVRAGSPDRHVRLRERPLLPPRPRAARPRA